MLPARRFDQTRVTHAFGDRSRLVENSVLRVPSIRGAHFCNAALRVWLRQKPADAEPEQGILAG